MAIPVAAIESITFMNGTEVPLPSPGVTLIVGPNNVGKTALLNELTRHLGLVAPGNVKLQVTSQINVSLADADALMDWVYSIGDRIPHSGEPPAEYAVRGNPIQRGAFLQSLAHYRSDGNPLKGHSSLFATSIDITSRASIASSAINLHNVLTDTPTDPVQHLFVEPELERRVSHLAEVNFGHPLTLNRQGILLQLYIGQTDQPPMLSNGLPNQEYIKAIHEMAPLSMQGHGVRSFIGIYLALATKPYPIVLIDEPDAFLHPPQARALGYEIARMAHEHETQVVIATHSLDFLKGVIDYDECKSAVLRLERQGAETSVNYLSPDVIRQLWADPLLRFSGVLDGLFYKLTILCEGDPDCRFFSAVGAVMNPPTNIISPAEVNFVPVGGKDRFPVALSALRAIGARSRVLADFDVINDRAKLAKLVSAAGGDPAEIQSDWNSGVKPIADLGVGVPVESLRQRLNEILGNATGKLTPEMKKQISKELVTNDSWSHVKRAGLSGVPGGEVRNACERLIAKLNRLGIFPSRYGELESLVPQVANHGPAWLAEVLAQRRHESCAEAEALLNAVLAVD